jgi:hypothetical protein
MFSCLGLPAILLRAAVELGLLAIAVLIVMRKHRTAGLMMAVGAMLSLMVSVGVPLMEVAGLTLVMQGSGSGTGGAETIGVVAFMIMPFITPLAQAVNIALIAGAVVLLANRLPDEEREWGDGG